MTHRHLRETTQSDVGMQVAVSCEGQSTAGHVEETAEATKVSDRA